MTEVVLFDMDGVFLTSSGTDPRVYRAAAHDALRGLGIRSVPSETATVLEAETYHPSMADACATLGIDRDAWWRSRERHASRRTNTRVRSGDRPLYDDSTAIASLPDGLSVGLVSNNRRATTEFVADYCFPGRFDVVVGREPTIDDYRRRKPEPDFLERALDRLDRAASGYYVGDRETDVVAAERAGLEAVLLDRPHTVLEAVEASPEHVVASLEEAVHVIETSME